MNDNATHIHKFEMAGLGKAPFKFVGIEELRGPITLLGGIQVGAPGQPMGSCDYCGNGIAICCRIRSSDGKEFVVGSTCVGKVGDKGLMRNISFEMREQKRLKALRADQDFISKWRTTYQANSSIGLAWMNEPHPHIPGRTFKEYIEFLFENAGVSGQMKAAGAVQKFLNTVQGKDATS